MARMDDTRARFLTAIAGRLGADRIVELQLLVHFVNEV